MRIVQAHKFLYGLGGAEKCVLGLLRLLEAEGHTVIPFASAHEENPSSRYENLFPPAIDFSSLREGLSPGRTLVTSAKVLWNRQARSRFRQLLLETKPDLVHAHMVSKHLSWPAIAVAREMGVPIVAHLHDYSVICPNGFLLVSAEYPCSQVLCAGGKFHRAIQYRCVGKSFAASTLCAAESYLNRALGIFRRHVKLFISPSLFLKRIAVRAGLPSQKIVVLPNFTPAPLARAPKSETETVLYFGRLAREKGLDTLLGAAEALRKIPFVIAGEGPQRQSLEESCRKRQITNVSFVGHIEGEGLSQLIESAFVTVLPSVWFENSPMSIIESFAHARPVIASHIGGIPELVSDGRNGFLIEPGNVLHLVERIGQLAENPGLQKEMGQHALDTYFSRHEPRAYYRNLMGIYSLVVS